VLPLDLRPSWRLALLIVVLHGLAGACMAIALPGFVGAVLAALEHAFRESATGEIVWNPSWTPPPTKWAENKKYQPPGAAANPMQAVKIYFQAPYYFIHGTNNPESIGEAASHGCIRMVPEDARALARRIERAGGNVPLIISP